MRFPLRRTIAFGLALVLGAGLLSGCKASKSAGKDTAVRSEEATPGEFPESGPPAPQAPPPPMLRDPKSAVYSYLLWISYAYRILNSDVATPTFSEWEEVRVNSYVELNRQNARAIDQRLMGFEPGSVRTKGDTATVPVREKWLYRYIRAADGTYDGPVHTVTYDTTYTVVNVSQKGWLVDSVEATPVGAKPE